MRGRGIGAVTLLPRPHEVHLCTAAQPSGMNANFLAAAREGDLAKLKQLHGESPVPAELCACRAAGASSNGHTALHWLAAGGFAEAAGWLIGQPGVANEIRTVEHSRKAML